MWLQKKFLELFKKSTPKKDQNGQNSSDEEINDSVSDIFDDGNLNNNPEEEK